MNTPADHAGQPTGPSSRAMSSSKGRWPKVLALLLLPVIVAMLLLAGLNQPAERLDTVPAAIVNHDKPVRVQGQLVPLGRQLAQAIAHPDAGRAGTYDWVVTNRDDAEAGLADGSYAAVVVIPPGFSRAATSLASDHPRRATITVQHGDRSGLANGVITSNLTAAAEQAFGADLTARYLKNLYLGFGQLGAGLGRLSDGADQLTDGTGQLADGLEQFSDGVGALATGTDSLATGSSELANGAGQLSTGVAAAADGATRLAKGDEGLADGVAELADGARQIASATGKAGEAAAEADSGTRELVTALAGLEEAYRLCQTDPARCAAALQQALSRLPDRQQLIALATASATANAYLNGAQGQPGLASGTDEFAAGASRLADGSAQAAAGTRELAAGLQRLAEGTGELADGTRQLADGADQLSDGTAQAAAGADPLATGARSLHDGTGRLADGLQQVTDRIPTYPREQRNAMAQVAAMPVTSAPASVDGLSWLGAALLATLTLWLGGLGTWLVLRPVPADLFGSSRSTARLAWEAAQPGLVIGAAQGLAVGAVAAAALESSFAARSIFVVLCVLAGAAYTAFLQGVMGRFGLLGSVVAVAWGAVALSAGLVSTVPAWFDVALTAPPFGPVVTGLQQVAAAEGFPVATVVMLFALALVGFLLTMAATRRHALTRAPSPVPT